MRRSAAKENPHVADVCTNARPARRGGTYARTSGCVCIRARTRTSHFTRFRVTLENSRRQSAVEEKRGKQRARLHFPLAVAPSFLRAFVVARAPALVLIINAFGSCRSFPQRFPFSLSLSFSHSRLICHSLERRTSVRGAFAPRAYIIRRGYTRAARRVASRRPPVGQIASFRHARAIKTNNRLFALMKLRVRSE